MKLAFLLSGEHEELPKAELKSVLDMYFKGYKITHDFDQIIVVELGNDALNKSRKPLAKFERLALTKAIYAFHGICKAEKNSIKALAKKADIKINGTFCVRMKRIKGYSKNINCLALERELGELFFKKNENAHADLTSPDELIQGVLTNGKFLLGKLIKEREENFTSRKAGKRPFFHPSTMNPKMARVLVNLAQVKEGNKVLDAFCGAGGILIEAGLVGAKVYGIDIDEKMCEGCRKNLEHFGIRGNVEAGDASNLKYKNYFDAVCADPPYGRCASTKGEDINKLYASSLKSIYSALKKGKLACMLSPSCIGLEQHAADAGFSVENVFLLRVHKSLTRKIAVLKKT